MKNIVMLFCAVLLCMTVGCATHRKTISAGQFILVDDTGKKRASLAMTNDGPQLALFGQDENLLVRLEALKDSSHLVLHSRLDGIASLAPVFIGVGKSGSEEAGFMQLVAYESSRADINCYYLLEPRKNIKGIRFSDRKGEGILSLEVTDKGLEMILKNKDNGINWASNPLG